MGDLSENFSRWEFACNCGCGYNTVDSELLEMLEEIRHHFGKPIKINSGCRCPSYNARIGGSEFSQHTKGRAADIVIDGVSPEIVQEYIDTEIAPGGLGKYETFTHIDSRTGYARWRG